ncbi:hypothetical protein, partial [Nocardioides albidus]|uniref:hypothetical protein n=1 Tax=Nocardioides albidus TaxID=1517589 RepID=UPI00195FF95E
MITPDRTAVWALWLLSRLTLVVLLTSGESVSISDLNYYEMSLDELGRDGAGGTLAEYPVPAFLVLAAPYGLLSLAGLTSTYPVVVLALLLAVDAGFLAQVRRAGRAAPVWAWLAATPALGAISYARFDLLPGVLVALALLHLV